jgi:hypothetical protein
VPQITDNRGHVWHVATLSSAIHRLLAISCPITLGASVYQIACRGNSCSEAKTLGEAKVVSWDQQFFDPIELPKGKPLVTLRDAALYVTELPKAEHDAAEWQAAMEALLLVAESGGPTMFARIGVMRALNRHVEREFNLSRKDTHWGRRKLARDR